MRLYDTLSREVVELRPRTPGEVSIYVCGPTVYDVPHLGHARTALTYDVLCRYLRWRGLTVRMVSNITDVDDKIIARAAEEGSTEEQVAARFTETYISEMGALGVAEPDERPRATGYIAGMVEFVEELLRKDAAYVIDGAGVYFDVDRYPDYGRLPHRRVDELRDSAGARVAVDERKHDPLDFALWKAAKPGEPAWEAPWMRGRPGWHIECVAMSLGILGDGFDIHGGGSDLIFPHHECERAQSQAATGEPFARHWMHQAMVRMDGEKMSKSLGNLVFVSDLLKEYDPRSVRLAALAHHYRESWEWRPAMMVEAAERLERWQGAASGDGPLADVRAALDADLDTPAALACIDGAVGRGQGVAASAMLLGVDLRAGETPRPERRGDGAACDPGGARR